MNINVTTSNQASASTAEAGEHDVVSAVISLLHTTYLPPVVRASSPTTIFEAYEGNHLLHHYQYYPASGGQPNSYTYTPAVHPAQQLLPFQQPSHPHPHVPYAVYEPVPSQEPSTDADHPFDYELDDDEDSSQVQAFSHEYEYGLCFVDDHQHEPDFDCPLQEYAIKPKRGKELFIGHLPFDMSEEELKGLCSQFGDVVSAYIKRYGVEDMEMSGCVAYVTFEQQSDADNALLRLNHYEVSIII